MNRILFSLAALLGALMPLVFDSALKGAALLAIAMLTTLALYRASAATRHLVWVVAVVALLVVPVLSVALPQWRVLPKWAASPLADTAPPAPPVAAAQGMERIPPSSEASAPREATTSIAPLSPPTASVVSLPPSSTSLAFRPATHEKPRAWRDWLPLAWCLGFAVLALRLLAAHLLLRRASRHCPALTAPPDEKIAAAFAEACRQLGISQRVTLLLDQRRTIPVVWGVFRPRLMLPIEARTWTDDQLRSVLLHELAHIKRRDTLVQWLTQIACALHWWNPLVWLAAWRLHAERERACDDLVLASGVRPSAYAEHLLNVATRLSPARWTSACGLAMARKSSLEGRLLAVLSDKLNRKGVTRALAFAALILGAAIALPIAMLRAAEKAPKVELAETKPQEKEKAPIAKSRGRILDRNGVVLAETSPDGVRGYPYKALAAHALGYVAPNGGSSAEGRTGVEKMFNDALAKGEDVALSIDARIQSIVERTLIDAGIGRGATVVIDLDDGGVVATVSVPNYDPSRLVSGDFIEYQKNRAFPLIDRTNYSAYPPGASFKPVTALAAAVSKISPQKTWTCTGGISYGGRLMKCTGSHGALDATSAIKKSCNCYFYQVANEVGIDPLEKTAKLLGLGAPLSGYLQNESGLIPDAAWCIKNLPNPNGGVSPGVIANMGIGMGAITATPLQMAWVAAQIAKSGKAMRPHIVNGPGELVDLADVGLSPEVFETVRLGMFKVVNEAGGTGGRAKSDKVQIAGKTGTVQMSRSLEMKDGKQERTPDYAVWFIGYAPADKPKYAFAVVVETGGNEGTGGKIGAPIARKIMLEAMSPLSQPAIIPESKGHFDEVKGVQFPGVTQIPGTPDTTPKLSPAPVVGPVAPSIPVGNPTPEIITNSLGMEFVLIGKTDFARNLVRVKDYEQFTTATGRVVIQTNGVSWKTPGFPQTPEHPVVSVSWNDAVAFCEWLTKIEREKGLLKPNEAYRLPTDIEWSTAAGMPKEKGATPEERNLGNEELFPWGTAWPPPPGAGNYQGEETKGEARLVGYRDDFEWTSPVGSFQPNALGLFDMGGNVWQWTMDDFNKSKERKTLRGGSWYNGGKKPAILLSCRYSAKPDGVNDTYGFRIVRAAVPASADVATLKSGEVAAAGAAIMNTQTNQIGKLAPETVAKLKWGEPVNGLRMALAWPPALGDASLGKTDYFQLVVQNVSEKPVHFITGDDAPNPRRMVYREGERIIQSLSDNDAQKTDWQLQPGDCGVLRLFSKEERDKDGKTISTLLEGDLAGATRYHAIATMEVAKAPAGAWTGKLTTGPTRGSADKAAAPAPKHKEARELYEIWQRLARGNGDIPGALVGELAAAVKRFIQYNPTWENVPQLNAILPRLDASRDWKAAETIALLDELAAVKDSPLDMASSNERPLGNGEKLPEKFADAPWKGTSPGGLRVAWMLEPGAAEYRIGAALKARLLVWNPGAVAVVVQVPTFHQGGVKATDAKGAEVEVSGIEWLTLPDSIPVRLGPGEFIEINTPGVGIGERAGREPWAGPRVGFNVLAKPGTDLTLTHSPVPLNGGEGGIRDGIPPVVGPGWWLKHIKTRLSRELPLPAAAAERTRLLDRAVRDLFTVAPTAEEIAAFTADQTPGALDALAKRLAERADAVEFAGSLPPAPLKMRVLAADANTDKQPRVALGPGEYPLPSASAQRGDVTLKIVGRPVGDRRTNDAQLIFEATEFTGARLPDPHKLELPDGWGTWAIVCRPSDGFFYVLHKGSVRKIDYSAPRKVTDTPANDLPAEFRDEVKRILDIHEISAAQQAEIFEKPAPPATTPAPKGAAEKPKSAGPSLEQLMGETPAAYASISDDVEKALAWGPSKKGLRVALVPIGSTRVSKNQVLDMNLVIQNVSDSDITLDMSREVHGWPTILTDTAGRRLMDASARSVGSMGQTVTLKPGAIQVMPTNSVLFGADKSVQSSRKRQIGAHYNPTQGEWQMKQRFEFSGKNWFGELAASPVQIAYVGDEVAIPNGNPIRVGTLLTEMKVAPTWGEEVGGLSAALQIPDNAIYGGQVRGFIWVRNSGTADVSFTQTRRQEFGVRLTAKDELGNVHFAKIEMRDAFPQYERWVLKPGHAVKAKEVAIHFAPPTEPQWEGKNGGHWFEPIFEIKPGKYTIMTEWSDSLAGSKNEGDWMGVLSMPTMPLRLQTYREFKEAPKTAGAGSDAKLITNSPPGATPLPKHETAQSLFKNWQASTRTDGKIPGALIGQLAETVDDFTKQYPKDDATPNLAAVRPKLDASRDWTQAELVPLLDEIAGIATAPLGWANLPMEFDAGRNVRTGQPLPKELESAAWGAPADNGLRAAWLLEPRAEQYALGTVLKARVLFHNSGKAPVVFETETWHQYDGHAARDAKGAEIPVKATWFTGITPMATFRLAPGEYCEVSGHGIAIGAGEYKEEHSTGSVGAVIEAKEGDEVTLSHTVDAAQGGWTKPNDPKDPAELRKRIIAERVQREAPLPASAEDRKLLRCRVTLDLVGELPTPEEVAAFIADDSPNALEKLIAELQTKAAQVPWSGKLPTGETKFRVIAADPDAAKKPRTATAPGRYVLGDGVHLQVRQVTENGKRTNSAEIIFLSPDPKKESPHKPYQIGFYVPDATYAFVWERGANKLWVTEISEGEPIRFWLLGTPDKPGPQKVTVRAFDFYNPADVKLTHVSCSENGGDWSWGKIVPAAFHQPVLDALGERGKRLRDFIEPQKEKPKDGAAAGAAPAGELVFIPSDAQLPAQPLDTGDGVTLEFKRITFSSGEKRAVTPAGGKPATQSGVYAILRWPARDGQPALEHGEQIVSDTIENPWRWAAAWQPGTKTVWLAGRYPTQPRPGFIEMTFPDSKQITVKHIYVNLRESQLPPAMPAAFLAKFGAFFDIAAASGTAQPEYFEKLEVHAAVPEDAKLHPGAKVGGERVANMDSAEWRVKFEHRDTGKPVTEVLARLTIFEADGSKRQSMLRTWKAGEPFHINFGADAVLRLVLTGTQYASIVVEDEKLTPGGMPVSYFGNVPDSVNAGLKHTNVQEPFVVKLWPRTEKKGATPGAAPVPAVEKPKGAQAKLTPDALLGFWRGKMDGKDLTLSFHRPPVEKDVQLDIYEGEATIGALAAFTIAADGGSAVVGSEGKDSAPFWTLRPGDAGTLKLELHNPQKGQKEVVLTHDVEEPATEPRQKEPRELFAMWKTTANADGTIPGTFIGALATEVRAYVKAHPNLDSGMKLPKLLPRFVTSRDWTQAEAIKLLDDVAHYATEPIAARVAKAKLAGGPLWQTMVEFADIPVQIAKWSETKDGLRIGMRVEGQWRIGGMVRIELWLHNAGEKDVTFKTSGPTKSDVGVWVTAVGADGTEHHTENGNLLIPFLFLDGALPAGHVAMAKTIEVTFSEPGNEEKGRMFETRFPGLEPGKYKLRCVWTDPSPNVSTAGDWTGTLAAPEVEFTLAAKTAR